MTDHMQSTNNLIHEKSPYLLQHAYNPVHWFPWNDDAFEKAKQEDKPILLSIGYSTCHWCHVMARESFEDGEVAEVLNKDFIAIKVDREERPDIDATYMKVCQMMTGEGGWPLTIVMTPDKIPFYAGTYFPKGTNYGLPGMMEMLLQLADKYKNEPNRITQITDSVETALQKSVQRKSEHQLDVHALEQVYHHFESNFDTQFGGFGAAPKFPQPQNIQFLLDYSIFKQAPQALKMAEKTLHQMAKGGIYDHIGFGFARYATDRAWLVPHFEKMLYDQAQLLYTYAHAFKLTKNSLYKEICDQIVNFISREMRSEEGAFYSAIDADSEGVEGKYYVWDYEVVLDILGETQGADFADFYGITPVGNFEGRNIPNLTHHVEDFPDTSKWELERRNLLVSREQRIYPHVDDKILTSWNAMMVQALAYASDVFHNPNMLHLAQNALEFLEKHLFEGNRLMTRYRDGETKYLGYLDDYAYLIQAYVSLYEATFQLKYLRKAKELTNQMLALFWDEKEGGFFQTGEDQASLISKEKEIFDGALPSGNSVAAKVLIKLGSLTGEVHYLKKVEEMYHSFYEDVYDYAHAAVAFVHNLIHNEKTSKEIVIIGDKKDATRQEILAALHNRNEPISMLVAEDAAQFSDIAPFAANYKKINDKTTIYVCENFHCHQPTNDWREALAYFN